MTTQRCAAAAAPTARSGLSASAAMCPARAQPAPANQCSASTRHVAVVQARPCQLNRGSVDQSGVIATLSRWRPRVRIPSGPLGTPTQHSLAGDHQAGVAQPGRAPRPHRGGHRFKSCRPYTPTHWHVAQSGQSARLIREASRWFESTRANYGGGGRVWLMAPSWKGGSGHSGPLVGSNPTLPANPALPASPATSPSDASTPQQQGSGGRYSMGAWQSGRLHQP